MKSRTFLAVFLLFLALAVFRGGERMRENGAGNAAVLSGDGFTVRITMADSVAERERGLGGRTALAADEGMLFVFPYADYHGIWMKNMLFPLDLIWLSEWKPQTHADEAQTNVEGRKTLVVVDRRDTVLPATYPEVFYPKEKARYVLEVKAGVAERMRIQVGEILEVAR